MRKLVALAMVGLCASCEPATSGPVNIMAILYDQSNQLGPQQTTLTTLGNISHLKGIVGNMVGGAQIIIDPNNPAQANLLGLSDEQIADALYTDRGGDVRADLIDKGGVLWPADFHSWNMVTTYWNFEQAYLYMNKMYDGSPTTELEGAPLLYWVDYEDLSIGDPNQQHLTNNALYYSFLHAFLLPPYADATCTADGGMDEPPGCNLPIMMNTGIIGHEYAHRVFNTKAGGGQAIPSYLSPSFTGLAANIVKSIDEGLADFHGYGVTCFTQGAGGPGCSTDFLAPSFGNDPEVKARDLSLEDKCLTTDLRTALTTLDTGTFTGEGFQYRIGTLFAASLYQAGNHAGGTSGTEEIAKALIRSYDDDANATPGFKQVFEANVASPEKITLEKMADIILSHITDPNLQRLTCNELWERLNLNNPDPLGGLTHCPNTSMRGSMNCPPLPPP
jgi:hypothetical protein